MKTKYLLFLAGITLGIAGFTIHHYGFTITDLASVSFYEGIANPSVRIVRVREGWRKEEVVSSIANTLGWDDSDKKDFLKAHLAFGVETSEGIYFPKTYLIEKDATPQEVSKIMIDQYTEKTSSIKRGKTTKILNEDTALLVASIIQREAGGKSDMRLISGIIWNRIFKGMKLQIDATLQYAKGDEDKWWPMVFPADKSINSPYNTYINKSLPPTAIANPGFAALEAAYNPQQTTCLFYLHDTNRQIHCSATYAEHLKNIQIYY